jgi:hypothetical protein
MGGGVAGGDKYAETGRQKQEKARPPVRWNSLNLSVYSARRWNPQLVVF